MQGTGTIATIKLKKTFLSPLITAFPSLFGENIYKNWQHLFDLENNFERL